MEEKKYLYGASVQGIQDFIFQRNKLKEIVGASELVSNICKDMFEDFGGKPEKSIVRAAGKIIHIFENEAECKKAVLEFPKKVMTEAPGITINQAVVMLEGDLSDYETKSKVLEQNLRIQRNKATRSMTLGLLATKRSPSTGLPAVIMDKGEFLDEASARKTQNTQTTKGLMKTLSGDDNIQHQEIAYNIEELAGEKSWVAIMHADGNGLGKIVETVCKNADDAKIFSNLLDKITVKAARHAYKYVESEFKGKIIPIRPIVLGGDDLTVICRADLAVDFTKAFLEEFEKQSIEQLQALNYEAVKKGLTACAGIAFVKASYPFHYAYNLAESLCSHAKKKAKLINKDLAPSCLMFHKVQDSFIEDYNEIVERELTPQKEPKLTFEFGPYYCGKYAETFGAQCNITVEDLLKNVKQLDGKEGNAIKSHIRQWLSLLFDNVEAANQKMKRLRSTNPDAAKLIDEKYEDAAKLEAIPYYDILSLATILIKRTSNNPPRHAELDSASPMFKEIADQVRNDVSGKSVVFRSTLKAKTERRQTP